MKLQIISDGTPGGTRVEDIETGDPLRGVQAVTWGIEIDGTAVAMIRVANVPLRAAADLDLSKSIISVDPEEQGLLEDSATIRDEEHDHEAPPADG